MSETTSAAADAMDWISGGDTGASSVSIWRHMMGLDAASAKWGASYPHDPDDFGRCYRLLQRVPAWRARIGEMAAYRGWSGLAREWDALTALYERDIDRSGPRHRGTSSDLYERMQTLIAESFDAQR